MGVLSTRRGSEPMSGPASTQQGSGPLSCCRLGGQAGTQQGSCPAFSGLNHKCCSASVALFPKPQRGLMAGPVWLALPRLWGFTSVNTAGPAGDETLLRCMQLPPRLGLGRGRACQSPCTTPLPASDPCGVLARCAATGAQTWGFRELSGAAHSPPGTSAAPSAAWPHRWRWTPRPRSRSWRRGRRRPA